MRLKSLLLLSGVCFAVASAPSHAETLEQAVSITLSQHPQVETANAALNRSRESQKEEYSAYFPELTVNATGGRVFGDNSTSRGLSVTRGTGYSHLWEGSVAARQKIFDGMETYNRVGAAKAQAKAAELALVDVRENLAYSAVQTYMNLLRVQKGLTLLKGQQNTVADYLDRIRTMVDDGAADEAELQQARDVSIILDNFIADYEGQARALEADYLELTGHLPESALEVPALAADQIPQDIEAALVQTRQDHPLLRSAEYQVQSAEHDWKAEKSTYIPKFDGELSFLKSDKDDVIGGELEDGKAVVRMNWGFETGGAQKARIKQRLYDYKEAQARTGEIQRQNERAIRLAYAELETAQRQLKNQKARLDLNKKLLDTYEVQFEGARISVLQLMQADNQALLTKLETENAKSRVLIAQYGILAAMGRLQNALNIQLAAAHPRREKK